MGVALSKLAFLFVQSGSHMVMSLMTMPTLVEVCDRADSDLLDFLRYSISRFP